MRALSMVVILAVAAISVQTRLVSAQDQKDQTLADIRQELSVLYVEIQKLKKELSTTGGPTVQVTGDSVLERVGSIETALQDLTAQTEELEFKVEEVVRDGTNRIGDLEFLLVELEGGDVSKLGETTTLGGANAAPPAPEAKDPPDTTGTELAIGEQADYDAANAAMDAGKYTEAADGYARFVQNYPGSPLAAKAQLSRGKALTQLEDTREAARSYLAAFSADPTGADAPESLTLLGAALGKLGQTNQACLTLAEVPVRFPMSDAVAVAQSERASLGCQ